MQLKMGADEGQPKRHNAGLISASVASSTETLDVGRTRAGESRELGAEQQERQSACP